MAPDQPGQRSAPHQRARRSWPLVLSGLLLLVGCGNDATPSGGALAVPSTSVTSGPTTSPNATTSPAYGTGGTASPSPRGGAVSADAARGPAVGLTYAQLYARRSQLVGQGVQVTAKAFFLSRCPPPGTSAECSLSGYLADPSRQDLLESDREQAIALAEGGRLLTCQESEAVAGGCPGWRHGATYELTVVVEHQVLGGRTTQYIDLNVISKRVH